MKKRERVVLLFPHLAGLTQHTLLHISKSNYYLQSISLMLGPAAKQALHKERQPFESLNPHNLYTIQVGTQTFSLPEG